MTSRFVGRDYATLRNEIIDFLKQRLPTDWDYTNLSDPVVVFAESLAKIGDQLHYTIDELRRECDMATAKRASSIYSYALREGYHMMLPKASSGTLYINSTKDTSDKRHLTINPFDEITVSTTGDTLYAMNALDADLHSVPDNDYLNSLKSNIIDYAAYSQDIYNRTLKLNVILGTKGEHLFTYNDINTDSTVELPDPMIDRDLVRLTVKTSKDSLGTEWRYVDDIIGSGFVGNIYTLTPKFIGGTIQLCIEFPTNYRDLFDQTATFKFEYISIENTQIDNTATVDLTNYITAINDTDVAIDDYVVDLGTGIKGYTEYEDAIATRDNYKKYVQNYSALLTKDDYANYIKVVTGLPCKVFDHGDNYKENVLPPGTVLMPRVIYILSDLAYNDREKLFKDLRERSSRSDGLFIVPYGKDPYTIFVKADCYLLGTSVLDISTKIKTAILKYYNDLFDEKIPVASMIDYLVHNASDKVIKMESLIVRDSTFGSSNNDFSDASTLSNADIDALFKSLSDNSDVSSAMATKYKIGSIEIKNDDGTVVTYTYNKYPTVTYNKFPDSFPKIYDADTGKTYDDYDSFIRAQVVYGEYDSKAWDIKDSEIFIQTPVINTEGHIIGYNMIINPEYIKHHYMMPYLNRVVVFIKAVDQ